MTHTIVEGTSEPQDMQLLDDDVALVGTGLTVGIEARAGEDITGVAVAWLSQANGTVRVTGVEDLTVGTYHIRYTLTDGGGDVGYVPNLSAASDEWRVVRV